MARKRHIDVEPPPPAEPANDPGGAVYTISEVAARWRVTTNTVRAAIKAGRLQAFKPDQRVYRIREAEVLRYEQQNLAVAS